MPNGAAARNVNVPACLIICGLLITMWNCHVLLVVHAAGHLKGVGDWCPLHQGDPMYNDAILLHADAGDLVLWDSRTVHGGRVGSGCCAGDGLGSSADCAGGNGGGGDSGGGVGVDSDRDRLLRLSCTVAMTPRSKATPAVLEARRRGFAAGASFNHCPHEAGTSSGTIRNTLPAACPRPVLADAVMALL